LLHHSLRVAETKTERGEVVAINQFIVFIIGAGGFGGKRQSSALKVSIIFLFRWQLLISFFCIVLYYYIADYEASQPFS
jgi:hypothetical protein